MRDFRNTPLISRSVLRCCFDVASRLMLLARYTIMVNVPSSSFGMKSAPSRLKMTDRQREKRATRRHDQPAQS